MDQVRNAMRNALASKRIGPLVGVAALAIGILPPSGIYQPLVYGQAANEQQPPSEQQPPAVESPPVESPPVESPPVESPAAEQEAEQEAAQSTADGISKDELERYVRQLSDPGYRNREVAMRHLVAAGTAAIEPLERAIRGGNLELIDRAGLILQDLALLEGPDDDGIAWDTLERLQQTGPGAASTRALSSLNLIRLERVQRARAGLAAADIKAGLQVYNYSVNSLVEDVGDIVQIGSEWNGDTAALEWLPWLYSTQVALVDGNAVTAEVIKGLASMPNLRDIRLSNGTLTGEELRNLASLKRIDRLELHFIDIGDQEGDLAALISLPIRQSLILTGTEFDYEDAEVIEAEFGDLEFTFSRGGFLGVQCNPNVPNCIINKVVPGSAADRAGLRETDQIVELGGNPIVRFEDLQEAVRKYKPGEDANIKILREGEEMTFEIDLGRMD
jgi:hypothetical protein